MMATIPSGLGANNQDLTLIAARQTLSTSDKRSTESNKMEIRSVYAGPRIQQEHLGHSRIHDALIIHWVAVFILVISQFTVIPMIAMITADTHRSVILTFSSNDGPAGFITTTAFKGPPELSP